MIPDAARCSTFALDLHRASGGHEPATASHLATCEPCRAYLASLDALDAVRPPPPASRSLHPRKGARWRWAMPAGAGLVMAAGVLAYVGSRDRTDGSYVGVKGMPSVELMIHRGDDTFIWNGSAPIRPGDALAFRVACEGLSQVAVAAPQPDAPTRWLRLKDAACPAGPSATLPFTLLVDGESQHERFAVVVSKTRLDDDALRSAASAGAQTADVWTARFDLPKTLGDAR
jgi:hypothetical protein